MKSTLRTHWQALVDSASRERFMVGASVFRIVAGLAFVYQYFATYTQRGYLFGPDGVYPFERFLDDVASGSSFSLYALSESNLYFELLYHAGCAVALLWLLGWRTRILTPLHWVLVWSLRERYPLLWDGGDNLMQLVLLYAVFMNVSEHFSLDSMRRAAQPLVERPIRAMFHNAGLLAAAMQLSLVYGIAGLSKVQGETWQNGTSLYYALRAGEFTWPGMSHLIYENSAVLVFLSYATVAFQVSFPFMLFLGRRTRLLWMLAGLCFHLGIATFMALFTFAMFMMAVDLIFITDAEYARGGALLGRARRWIARPFVRRRPAVFTAEGAKSAESV
jgi:hypothetical protein